MAPGVIAPESREGYRIRVGRADEEQTLLGIAEALGHSFDDLGWLATALTHRSYRHEHSKFVKRDNERLEFLGDAVLGVCVAEMLFERYPDLREGQLTRRRAELVCEKQLAEVARRLALGEALRLGKGEEKTGGRDKPRLLASALEACVGAVYRDGGHEAAWGAVRRQFEALLEAATGARDHKSQVQEFTQARGRGTPSYRVLVEEGPDHDRRFTVAIELDGEVVAEGTGRSKAEAEQIAAESALVKLEVGA